MAAWGGGRFCIGGSAPPEPSEDFAAHEVAHALGEEKNLATMTREEFYALPKRTIPPLSHPETYEIVNWIIVLPALDDEELHNSGWRGMDFVVCRADGLLYRYSAFSDVIHFDGIGGYRNPDIYPERPREMSSPPGWDIDCLPRSGLLRIKCNGRIALEHHPMSSFEIFSTPRESK